jgi:hypothetical protein
MTPEARLNRLERIAKLFVKAGRRYRNNLRALDERINIVVDSQMRNYEQFARDEERFARNEANLNARSERTDLRFAQLAESQASTDRRLNALIDLLNRENRGNGS